MDEPQAEQMQRLIKLYNRGLQFEYADRKLFDKLMLVPGAREMFVAHTAVEGHRRKVNFDERQALWLSSQEAKDVEIELRSRSFNGKKLKEALEDIASQGAAMVDNQRQNVSKVKLLVDIYCSGPQADLQTLLEFAEIIKGEEGQP